MLFFLGLVLVVVLLCLFYFKFQRIRCGNMVLITGGLKTGKSMLSVFLVRQLVRKQRIKVWIYNHVFRWFLGKKFVKKERPLVYSNIPLGMDYVPLTKELLTRQTRFVYGSVVYVCECSLVADSMSYKDVDFNEMLLLFNKLFAHETKGGYLVYDTQSISDNHYAVKRCLNSYFYIHHMVKVPFFCVMYLREERYTEDRQTVNTIAETADEGYKIILVPKKVWKLYDRYCYSYFTDSLECISKQEKKRKRNNMKAKDIVSFKDYKTLKGGRK